MSESEDEAVDDVDEEEESVEDEDIDDESSVEAEDYDEISSLQEGEVLENNSSSRFTNLSSYIEKNHPEKISATVAEMHEQMSKKMKTLNFLTRFEVTSILGFRTLQLNQGSEPFIETDLMESYEIAKKELELAKLPFILRRPLPDGTFEYVRCSDLSFIV